MFGNMIRHLPLIPVKKLVPIYGIKKLKEQTVNVERQLASPPVTFASPADPNYRRMLTIIRTAQANALAKPRVDMPGVTAIAQQRDFGKLY